MGGWLGARTGGTASKSMTALDEQQALAEALASAALIINDETERAEAELSKGTSPFHKLGRATAVFLRATLGFEKEIMAQASDRIAEAEEAASEYHRRAVRDPSTAHHSKIYPAGAEYALCHAEAQLMSAVVGVLNESLTESLRGFYKLRKAFSTLYEINEAEQRFRRERDASDHSSHQSSATSSSTTIPSDPATTYSDSKGADIAPNTPPSSDEDSDLEFVDAEDSPSNSKPTLKYHGSYETPDMKSLNLNNSTPSQPNITDPSASFPSSVTADSQSAAHAADQEVDFRTLTSDPIDIFIHSGTGLCYGLLQLLLSMIPPAFGKLLSLFSFRGDREAGLRLLWSATKFKHNINGAMAGLITLGFHNAAIALCDILSKDALPEERLRNLLKEMRKLYPKSNMWLLEECRMLSREKKLEQSISLLKNRPKPALKQVEALGLFEMSLSLLYTHQYEDCAESFIKCVGLNNWSHAMYYYIAASSYTELYRIHKPSDPKKASEYAAKAEQHFREVPMHTGKKRLMARQLPFDVFVGRKIAKWEARAKARDCSLVDAVGVSPAVEMTYFWSGYTRMAPEHVRLSLERLAWSEDPSQNPGWADETPDEKAVHSFLRGVCQRFLGDLEGSKATHTNDVLCHELHTLKACEHPDTWPLPVAHYELAVLHWFLAGKDEADKAGLEKCSEELAKVENWEAFELDARVGMKIRTARETLRKVGSGK